MRTVTSGAACSLDGFIARPDGGVEWLRFRDDVRRMTSRYCAGVDAVLLGRRTYEAAPAIGHGASPGVATYVFLRTSRTPGCGASRMVREDAATFVAYRKREAGARSASSAAACWPRRCSTEGWWTRWG